VNNTKPSVYIWILWEFAIFPLLLSHFSNKDNEHVDIKFCVYDEFLEKPSSGMLKIERLESKII